MAVENNMALADISAFIDQNADNLRRVKSENPSLYGVVADTLAFLNRKFGGEEAPPIVMPEIEEQKPEVVEQKAQEDELPKVEVGDMFSSPNALNQIYKIHSIKGYEVIVHINDINTGERYPWTTSVRYLQGEIMVGNLVKIEQKKEELRFDVGDLFFIVGFPNQVYQITDISQGQVSFKRKPLSSSLTEKFTKDDFDLQVEDKGIILLPKIDELPFEVDDFIITESGDVSKIYNIDLNTNRLFLSDKTSQNIKTVVLTEVVDRINDGTLKVQKVSQFTAYPFKVGDIIINSANQRLRIEDLSFLKNTITVFNLNNGNELELDIDAILDGISQGILKVEEQSTQSAIATSAPTTSSTSSSYSFKVGDKFRLKIDTSTPPNVIYTIKNINSDWDSITYDIFDKLSRTTQEYGDSIRDFKKELDDGIIVQYVPQLPLVPPQTNNYSFKEGDIIYYASSPKVLYTIKEIKSYGDVEVEEYTGAEWTWDAQSMQDDIDAGVLVIAQPNVLTPTPPQATQPATLTIQEQIQQLKDEIDGFQILADIGDTDALEEVKKLKKELKSLKSRNK